MGHYRVIMGGQHLPVEGTHGEPLARVGVRGLLLPPVGLRLHLEAHCLVHLVQEGGYMRYTWYRREAMKP